MDGPKELHDSPRTEISNEEDMAGRHRIMHNVAVGWASQFAFVVAGFILPRLIDVHLGQNALGVWDFGWSMVAYFGLVLVGVISSINRYVAKFRAVNDVEGVNISVSSVTCILLVMALIVVVLTIGATLAVPCLLSTKLGDSVPDAQWVVFLLGMSLVIQMVTSGYGGVLTGCHRWDLHHGINASCRILTMFGMIGVLVFGGGLRGLALVILIGEMFGFGSRYFLAYRVYPGLSVRVSHARWHTAKNMLKFGGKTFLPSLGELFSNQTISLLIIWFIGPGALALFSRPRHLVHHVQTFVVRYAFVFTPTASSLQAMDRQRSLQHLFLEAARNGAFIALPMVLVLAILGGPILHLWMGKEYEDQLLLAVLAVGYLPVLLQLTSMSILRGVNIHRIPGLIKLIASVFGIAGAILLLGPLQWGVTWAAIAVVAPLGLVDGIYLPLYVRQRLKIPLRKYLKQSVLEPVLCVLPFAMCLLFARIGFANRHIWALAIGMGVGMPVLAFTYWRHAFTKEFRTKITVKLGIFSEAQ